MTNERSHSMTVRSFVLLVFLFNSAFVIRHSAFNYPQRLTMRFVLFNLRSADAIEPIY